VKHMLAKICCAAAALLLAACGFEGSVAVIGGADGPTSILVTKGSSADASLEPPQGVSFTDALGNPVRVQTPQRVVSLMGSFSEMWINAGGTLVGVTDDAYSERGLSLGDDVVTLGSYKTPSLEKILSLDPDFVILSADTSEHVALCQTLLQAGVNAACLRVGLFEEYLEVFDILTQITARRDLYEQNGLAVQRQIDAAIALAQGRKSPDVLFVRAFSSGYRAKDSDSMTGAMLRDLGAVNIADSQQSLLEDLSMEAIIAQDPDFILVVVMGADVDKALSVVDAQLRSNPAWAGLSAVKNDRYHVLPRELFHYKPNARWGESYEYLAQILYG
jgi:iron complex transport system substrate-binding protein